MKRSLVVGLVLSLTFWMVGCSGDEEEPSLAIASDACALLQEEVLDRGPEALMAGELADDFEELEERARDAGVSDPEMEEAMRARCPGVFDELEALFGP